jgi:hypothetical protein
MALSIKNLTDCWWQIPPIGKDFQPAFPLQNEDFPNLWTFTQFGTALVWLGTGLGP